jgi:hypothetical protein
MFKAWFLMLWKNIPNRGYNVRLQSITLLLYKITWLRFMGSKLLISINSLMVPLYFPSSKRIALEISDFLKKQFLNKIS